MVIVLASSNPANNVHGFAFCLRAIILSVAAGLGAIPKVLRDEYVKLYVDTRNPGGALCVCELATAREEVSPVSLSWAQRKRSLTWWNTSGKPDRWLGVHTLRSMIHCGAPETASAGCYMLRVRLVETSYPLAHLFSPPYPHPHP